MDTLDRDGVVMDTESQEIATDSGTQETLEASRCAKIRNLTGFWLLGLCNNFAYVVMLTAAHDILADRTHNGTDSSIIVPSNRTHKLIPECNKIGTGAILLADIIPSLLIKLTAPLYIQAMPYSLRVVIVTALGMVSFLLVALPQVVWVNICGVALASAASGLGEITFLALSTFFTTNSVSTWSSGTGAAGVFGALSYAGLTALGVSPKVSILSMTPVPLILAFSYFFLLTSRDDPSDGSRHDSSGRSRSSSVQKIEAVTEPEDEQPLLSPDTRPYKPIKSMNLVERLALVKPLVKFMLPLGIVYFAEYFINQALQELIYFNHIWLPVEQQYRWYQTIYQVGVLLSRSSVNLVKIRKLWILSILQCLNIPLLLLQIFFRFLPSIWVVFIIILYEGLLGGAAYVNTFYRINTEIRPSEYAEYSMGVASLADTFGIAISGAIAIPFHNFMCTL